MRGLLTPLIDADPLQLVTKARGLRKRAKQWWKHRQTDVYLVSFPGCGRTWLTMLIWKAFVDEYQVRDAEPGKLHPLHALEPRIPTMRQVHDGDPQLKHVTEIEAEKSRFADKVVILMVRDPRDAFISYYFEGSRRRGRFTSTVSEFLRSEVGSIDSIIAYYNVWAAQRKVPRRFCMVRYEDLKRNPRDELARGMQTIGHVLSDAVLDRAIEFAKFENMRKLEETGSGHPALARNKNLEDKETFKTRKGKVGGYREYLSPEDLAFLENRISARLSAFFEGYFRPSA